MDDTVIAPLEATDVSYDADFYAWTMDQSRKLRAGRLSDLDLPNLAEEIESMGRSEKRELTRRLSVLIDHLLKWAAQPARRSRSWTLTIGEQRDQSALLFRDNPSLRPMLPQIMMDAYELGRRKAMRETKLPATKFPVSCPWGWQQMQDEAFLPEPFNPP